MPTQNPFEQFLDLYANACARFVEDVLGMDGNDALHTIDDDQRALMDAVSRGERRISVRSGHGVGKTTVLAWIIVWHIVCKFPQKTVSTAPTSGQLFDALAAETVTWMKKLPPDLFKLFEIKTDSISLISAPEESFIAFKTSRPETPEALAGVHSPGWVLLIGDEASGIPEAVYEAASGSMSGHNACTILAGNPVRTSGLFFDTHNKLKDMWFTMHISCVGHPRISPDFIEDMRRRYGEDSNAFRVRVLGEFPKAEDDRVIPYELLQMALMRDVQANSARPVWGVDVAGAGQDKSALAKRKGNVLQERVRTWAGLDTMQLVGQIKIEWDMARDSERPEGIYVDAIGLGAGVASRLQEMGLPAFAVNVSELPALRPLYRNLKAELWFLGREWFSMRDCNLSGDTDLAEELGAVGYKAAESSGKIVIESKDQLRKRMPSPDRADAFILTFAAPASTALYGNKASKSWNTPLKREIKGIV